MDHREGWEEETDCGGEGFQEAKGEQQGQWGEQHEWERIAEDIQPHEVQATKTHQTCSWTETRYLRSQNSQLKDEQQDGQPRSQEKASQTLLYFATIALGIYSSHSGKIHYIQDGDLCLYM